MTHADKQRRIQEISTQCDKPFTRTEIEELIGLWDRSRLQTMSKAFGLRATGTTSELRKRLQAWEDSTRPKSYDWYWTGKDG